MRLADVCPADVVIDTNVLSHADNEAMAERLASVAVLQWMSAGEQKWVVDDQGRVQPDPMTSVLISEYMTTLAPQSYGRAVFIQCMQTQRLAFAPRPDRQTRELIQRLVPRNPKDRAVLGAAAGSTDRVLVSNDLSDFTDEVRDEADVALGVLILTADEAATS